MPKSKRTKVTPKLPPTNKIVTKKRHQAPARTIESRENQLISLAVDLAEKQIRNGSASSQVITHFLKLGATNSQLEKEKLRKENLLLEAKTEAIKSSKKVEDLYADALRAMRQYSGQTTTSTEDSENED